MRRCLLFLGALLVFGVAAPVHAEEPKNKGLFVTPVREYINIAPGTEQEKSVTIANNTDNPMSVKMSVETFKVADYTYSFIFETAKEDWITFSESSFELIPNQNKVVKYTVKPPQNATPGGHYFTLFATATVETGAVKSQVRAATTLYITATGDLTISSSIQKTDIPRFVFSGDIPFTVDIKNTGNTHFFVYVGGNLEGLTASGKGPEATHLLMPNATRTVGSTMAAPILPGIYTATFGYTAENGKVAQRVSRVVYIPIWSWLVTGGLVWLVVVGVRYLRRRNVVKDFGRQQYK